MSIFLILWGPRALKRVVGGPLIFSKFYRIFTFSTPRGGSSDPILGKWAIEAIQFTWIGLFSVIFKTKLILWYVDWWLARPFSRCSGNARQHLWQRCQPKMPLENFFIFAFISQLCKGSAANLKWRTTRLTLLRWMVINKNRNKQKKRTHNENKNEDLATPFSSEVGIYREKK